MTIRDKGSQELLKFQVVRTVAFTVERKRHTVIVRNPQDGRLYVFMKGADEVVFRLLADDKNDEGAAQKFMQLKNAVDAYAEDGLRTLVFAMRVLESDLSDEDVNNMTEEELESQMRLIGVVGEADKMQEEVHSCVSEFIAAGIKVWIVTGDKDSTAKAIGLASGILSSERELVKVEFNQDIDFVIDKILNSGSEKDFLISGTAIQVLIDSIKTMHDEKSKKREALIKAFLEAKGFVVYRSSPKQKAALVAFIKSICKNKTTLAIGDGANDVNMIQTAHIGVGIMGKEGRQASSFADFAIGKFKFLRRLLFWHGSNFGYNMTNFMCLILTKSIVTGAAKLFFNIHAAYSAMDFIDGYFFVGYATLMTQYGFYLWFEQQHCSQLYGDEEYKLAFRLSENYPVVRDSFIKRVKRRFIIYQTATFWAGFWCFYIPFNVMGDIVDKDGRGFGVHDIGLLAQMCFVFLNHLNFNTVIRRYDKPMRIFVMITLVGYCMILTVGCVIPGLSPNFYMRVPEVIGSPLYWLTFLPTLALSFLPYYLEKCYWTLWRFPQIRCDNPAQ